MTKTTYGRATLLKQQKGRCYFCKGILPNNNHLAIIHHINGDSYDNRMANRCIVHATCHRIHHDSKNKTYPKIPI